MGAAGYVTFLWCTLHLRFRCARNPLDTSVPTPFAYMVGLLMAEHVPAELEIRNPEAEADLAYS